jgi:hypothetical protein
MTGAERALDERRAGLDASREPGGELRVPEGKCVPHELGQPFGVVFYRGGFRESGGPRQDSSTERLIIRGGTGVEVGIRLVTLRMVAPFLARAE